MKIRKKFFVAALIFGLGESVWGQSAPIQVSLCEVLRDPQSFDGRLIEVSGDISRGFEDFTLRPAQCETRQIGVWLMFGGTLGSDTVYCCGDTSDRGIRSKPLVIDGMPTTLEMDSKFDEFQKLTIKGPREYGHANSTIVGRFLAKKEELIDGGKAKRISGYGHFGMFNLLIIQKIIRVQAK